jgi:prenyltransferase beta subunit
VEEGHATRVPVSDEPDLWCTYAAVRTMAWLGRADRVVAADRTARYVAGRRNSDGGFAWSRGMASDAWATFYCTATLADLGLPQEDPDGTARWLRASWAGDAYAMTPGQEPDVWATHFSTRTCVDVCGQDVPDRAALLSWLASLQSADGGLSWSPAHARHGEPDVRACYYGVAAWQALARREPVDPPWDVHALAAWLRARQDRSGGFTFDAHATVPCMWATYRAVGALTALGAAPSRDCTPWIMRQRTGDGAFTRWPGYGTADVWASFCAVGALGLLGRIPAGTADAVERRISAFACPEGGFTYREPAAAANALQVSAAALTAPLDDPALPALRAWLAGCRLPNEDGVMYMPGRGAEVRCTLWAVAAGALDGDADAARAVGTWLVNLQNPDGGFGYWHGRGSDLVSTAAAVETWRLLSPHRPPPLDHDALAPPPPADAAPTGAEPAETGHSNIPGGCPSLRAGLQALRVKAFLGAADPARAAARLLDRHRVRSGGWADTGNRLPDLLSTYEAVATADRLGLAWDSGPVRAFLDRTDHPAGAAWSPLAPGTADPLAGCLHRLLQSRCDEPSRPLPALTLS